MQKFVDSMVIKITIVIYDSTILRSKNKGAIRIVDRNRKLVESYDFNLNKIYRGRIITRFYDPKI